MVAYLHKNQNESLVYCFCNLDSSNQPENFTLSSDFPTHFLTFAHDFLITFAVGQPKLLKVLNRFLPLGPRMPYIIVQCKTYQTDLFMLFLLKSVDNGIALFMTIVY